MALRNVITKTEYTNSSWRSVAKAQRVTNNPNEYATSEQWQNLVQELLKAVIESWGNNGDYVGNATTRVLEWDRKVNHAELRLLFGRTLLNNLNEWQMFLFDRVSKRKQTLKVYIWDKGFWVVVKRPSTNLVFKYSSDYIEMKKKYVDVQCDFFVIGKDQANDISLPEGINVVEVVINAE